MKHILLTLTVAIVCCFSTQVFAQKDVQKRIQTQLILAENNSTITIPEGNFTFTGSLSLEGKKNIIIKGQGINKTTLVFKGQTEGAEGIRVSNAENITIQDLTVQDSKGDAIKTMNVKGISFINVRTEWTGIPKKENGAYGFYPVQCDNVLIDRCEAIGASDAGIYVGQSRGIIVKNCRAFHNVAGIEIENSINAEVFDNEATENTGGILVFDLPDLVQKKGGNCKIYRNKIYNNNYPNFAPPANIVGKVPDGTGIMILAANNVEIFDNQIINNKTVGAGIISYFMTETPIKDTEYYPYPNKINIHNNVFERQDVRPTSRGRMGKIYRFKLKFGKNVPHIQWDGIEDKNNPFEMCVKENKNESFANFDAENNFKNISKDISKLRCNQ